MWTMLGAQLRMIGTNALSGLCWSAWCCTCFSIRVSPPAAAGIPVSFLLGMALFHLVFGYGIAIVSLIGLDHGARHRGG
ncbi:MAG: hypothetical protein R3E84_19145 [Pseudomonadales bacterium]